MSNASRASRLALLSPSVRDNNNIGDKFIELGIERLLDKDTIYGHFSLNEATTGDWIDEVNTYDAAIICGTNLYQHRWPVAITEDIVLRLAVPVIPFGIGSSAKLLRHTHVAKKSRNMIRAIHRTCHAAGVRDPYTMAVIRRAAVTNNLLTGCPVLHWNGTEALPQVTARRRDRLVITARNYLMHRDPEAVNHPAQIHYLKAIVDAFPDVEIVYAIHEDFDIELAEATGLDKSAMLFTRDVDDYIALYSDPSSVVLAMRLHAGMLALANGVPALFVGHDTRTYSFCQMMGLDYIHLFCDIPATDTIRSLRMLLGGDTTSFANAYDRFPQLYAGMQTFMSENGLPAAGARNRSGSLDRQLVC